jgi:hypothetical protein
MVDLALLQSVSYIAGALGVCVAAVYYVLNLRISQRNQELSLKAFENSAKAQQQTLETRQAQMFMDVYKQVTSNEFLTAWGKVAMSPWKTYEEWNDLYKKDSAFRDAENLTQFFYEGLGTLVREELLPIRMVALLMCGMTRYHWERHVSMVEEGRRAIGHRRWFSEEEYLYDELIKYLGVHPELDTRVENPTWLK